MLSTFTVSPNTKSKSDCDSLGKGHSGVCYDILNYLQIPEIGAINTR